MTKINKLYNEFKLDWQGQIPTHFSQKTSLNKYLNQLYWNGSIETDVNSCKLLG